ncbi:MAG TPA: FAD-dependent monooxygenase [Chloroflexota bacterium]|nr:FAD-dependent monooxygenase [Chloroflexota bacterium]
MAIEWHEVVIVGGGPAGAATAILLRWRGHAVTLLEKAYLPRPKPCGESLSPEATPLLAALGVLDELRAGLHGTRAGFAIYPYGDAPFRGTYAAGSGGNPAHPSGLSIPRLRLDAALLNAARAAGVTVREGWAVRGAGAWDGAARTVDGQDAGGQPFTLRTPLLIGADGVHSTIARRLGLTHPSQRLRQLAIVTHMRGVADLGAYGEMHVTPTGYCGVAPLSDGVANVAMVVPAPSSHAATRGTWRRASQRSSSKARAARAGSGTAASPREAMGGIEGYLRAHLCSYPHLGDRLRDAEIVAGPWTTSGLACRVARRVDDGLLLVGDAGGYYDPFTGEGIFRGLRSAVLASETAGTALARGDTRAAQLRPYAWAYTREFTPKRLVEVIVHEVITRRSLFEHVARRLRRHPQLADALVGVTGDIRSPYEVLSPWYLARLFV